MIDGSTLIRYVDVGAQKFGETSIYNLWQMYSSEIHQDETGSRFVDMIRRERVYVQDLYGWTRLLRIIRFEEMLDDSVIWEIRYKDHQLHIDYNGLLPVWNPNDPTFGFHGIIHYPYRLVNPDTLYDMEKEGWRMRIRNSEGEEFQRTINIHPLVRGVPKVRYSLWTESRFYNANGIYMFGSGDIEYSKIVVRKDFHIE